MVRLGTQEDPKDSGELHRLRERLRILSEATRAFAEVTVDYGRLVETITDSVARVIGDACLLSVLAEDGRFLDPISIASNSDETLAHLRGALEADPLRLDRPSLSEAVFRTGVSALVPHLDYDALAPTTAPFYAQTLRQQGVHSLLLVALRVQGRSIGALTLLRYRPEAPPFDEHDRDLAEALADLAALSVETSRHVELRRGAEARFQRLSEAGMIGILVADIAGKVSEINDTLLAMLGYSREEVLSGAVPWPQLTPPGWEHVDALAREQLARTGTASLREKEYLHKDGTRVPVLLGSARLAGGDPRIISFVLDLTARKRAEAVLQVEQSRFRALVEKSADGIAIAREDSQFVYVSPAAARMLGEAPEAVIGRSFRDFVHPEDLPAAIEQRRLLAPGETTPPTVRRIVRRDGSIRWVEVTATNRVNEPAIAGLVSNVRDVTDEHAAMAARVAAERRFTALFEAGIVGIILADEKGQIHDANDTFLGLVGYSRADLAAGQLDWARLTPPEWVTWNQEAADELRSTGRAQPREREYLRKDGTRVPVLVGIAQVEGALALSVSIDLSDRKRSEAAKANLELHLRHAQKMEAVGRLAGGVAHDFNNMLSVILSYCDVLLDHSEPGSQGLEEVTEIRKAGRRAEALTRQLLAFSRHQGSERKLVDVNALVGNMEKMLQRILGEDIDLVLVSDPDAGRVHLDPSALEQILMNLVVNARDAMPRGGKLTIETARTVLDEKFATEHISVRAGPHVLLAITDTGIGMDKPTQARAFEPFFTTKEAGKGTGLGLATVFGIVTQVGGGVWLYSEPGKGTTFKIYLPRVETPDSSVDAAARPLPARGGETILLVEDDDQLRAVAHRVLARSGYVVHTAANGPDALRLIESDGVHIDLLLTDVVMPLMSGADLAERVRRVRPGVKVLCMSGYTDDAIVRHGVLEAHFAFMQKPITPDTLTRKVREVLDSA